MPIYAYRCESCGFTKDALQKLSDAPLTQCTSCDQPTLKKQLTAAGFQLKGTGWYVTDFRGGSGSGGTSEPAVETTAASAPAADSASPATGAAASATTSSPATPAASPAPAAAAGPTAAS